MRHVHSVHVTTTKKKWQTVLPHKDDDHASEVRRLPVPGGWLYQVERRREVDDIDEISRVEWSSPVFVPFHGDGDGA